MKHAQGMLFRYARIEENSMSMRTCRHAVTRVLLLLGVVLGAPALADPDYSNIVIFGDSLSDPGNAFVLTGQTSRPPYDLIPGAPYARGGQRFSNGRIWAERFAHEMDLRAGPAFRNPRVYSNYAVGGARARTDGSVDLTAQVASTLG
ncbi:MAG: GDSL family lipase, partial [Planctomycetia bacterium]|nr:GDSL family lipase [Planctomycetia bacterium]